MAYSLGVAVPTKQSNKPLTKLLELKSIRNHGDCPASELKEQKREAQSLQESADLDSSSFTVESLIELYLQRYKVIPGARKRKGQIEARRTLHADVVTKLGNRAASEITRKDYVQLPSQAVEFLKTFKQGGREFVFESKLSKSHITQKSLSEHSWVLRVAKKMLNIDPWTPHDLRRTVRTGLSKLQCPSEVAEAVLGHARKGIEGTYDLHSYDQESRVWLQKWADHVDSLENTISAN